MEILYLGIIIGAGIGIIVGFIMGYFFFKVD